MRVRVAATVAALVVLAAVLMRQTSPGASARPAEERRVPASPVAEATPGPVPQPARDVFRYARDEEPPPPRPRGGPEPEELVAPPALTPPPASPDTGPRLIGLLRRSGTLQAAVWVDGETLVVGEGDRAGAYTVSAIDEDGVTLRDGAGGTLTLSTPQG